MKIRFFFLVLISLTLIYSCESDEKSKEEYELWLDETYKELVAISESVECNNADEWEFAAIGRSYCGGPAYYLPYHQSVNTILFQKKIEGFNNVSDNYMEKWHSEVACTMIYWPPPTGVKCEDGKAVLEYTEGCDDVVRIWPEGYETANAEGLNIKNISIEGNCLNVEYISSGCDGSTWQLQLIDSGAVAESYPVQRYLRFNFVNTEECDAVIEKQKSFYIKTLRDSEEAVILHLDGWDESVLYE